MDLQILVPQYGETDEVVKPLLDSIAIQQGIQFDRIGVVICNDGSSVILSDKLLQQYPFRIDYYREPHRGVSGTRNACLDHATADYVMFCDADDMFFNALGLMMVFTEIRNRFDCLVSLFIEEARMPDGRTEFINHENDKTFVHGKVFRRKYLTDNNIRFCDRLTIHEDSYFNILAQRCSGNTRYCQTAFYMWKWRDESVCRRDPKYPVRTMINLIDSGDALIREIYHRGMRDTAIELVGSAMFDYYYTLCRPVWHDPHNRKFREATEKRIAAFYRKYHALWDAVPDDARMAVSAEARQVSIRNGMQMEPVTFSEWLDHIESLIQEGKKND